MSEQQLSIVELLSMDVDKYEARSNQSTVPSTLKNFI